MTPSHKPALRSRRLAWDGLEFRVPWNWDIGLYKFLRKGVTRVEIEDEYAVRLEAEWLRPRRKPDHASILKRYHKAVEKFTKSATEELPVKGLPAGWTATRFIIKETAPNAGNSGLKIVEQQHVAALYLSPNSELVFFAFIHCIKEDQESPADLIRLVAADFRHHGRAKLVPWELFDISFELPPEFLLESTLFDVGSKLMVFRWKMRRFYLWHFSCADMFLKDGVVMEEWVTGYLNAFSAIRGPIFRPGRNGEILWKRLWKHPFGHRDEIGRYCFKYRIRCRRDLEKNQLVAWVFNYRKDADLDMIPADLRFPRP